VKFPVVDDGKVLQLARDTPGAKLKRWKTLTTNQIVAKQHEAMIKTDLMMGKIVRERVKGPMTFKALTDADLAGPSFNASGSIKRRKTGLQKDFSLPSEPLLC